jgi:amino-acid N-acetyltransferase
MKAKNVPGLRIRKAKLKDCVAMRDIINTHAREGLMLPRSLNKLVILLPQYFVAEIKNAIVGVCGYQIWPSEGIEIISSAVISRLHGRGIGQKLINSCIQETKRMGFKKFFALTLQAEFFGKLGFTIVDKESLSPKIYAECISCPNNRSNEVDKIECDEVAVVKKL